MKLQRIAIFFIIAISLTAFLIPAIRMPDIPRVEPPTIEMPQPGQGMAVEIGYMIISGLLAGFSPLLFLASLFLGMLLFIYNKSRIPQYSRYYIIGAFVIFFTFQYRITLPGGIESSIFGFQVLMIMGVISMLLALIALEFSPEFAARMARNESVKVTYFIFIGALIALVIVMYGDGATTPAVDFAASTGHGLSELLVYNLCAMVPSTALFAILSMNRISMRTKLANNRESILLIGTIILVISLLIIEVISLLS